MPQTGELPQRPYLIRAMHAWITDNGQTPHIVVDATLDGVAVPSQYVRDGRIVLNIAGSAVTSLQIGNDLVTFQARFGGVAWAVQVPIGAVLGIYARETGRGMIFSAEDGGEGPQSPTPAPPAGEAPGGTARKARLKLVK